ncbi:peptidylprolyl isomerase [Candidatus Woesearchaeota archaeon]|nr:peptidylprolyl isomerase [Candidatus Woesearchaeota archaeon]
MTPTKPQVKNGDKVKVHYTGKLNDGTVFDSSEGRNPLLFTVGKGQVIPGFEKGVTSLKLNEPKTINIPAAEAYGPSRKELVIELPRTQLPANPEPKAGMGLMLRDPQGRSLPARITEVKTDKVVLDLNHPLAGKDLTFEVKVVGINEPDDKEEEESGDCHCGDGDCKSHGGDEHECNCKEEGHECKCGHGHHK